MKWIIASVLFAVWVSNPMGVSAINAVAAQPDAGSTQPSFEVVSVRRVVDNPTAGSGGTVSGISHGMANYLPDRVKFQMTLKELIIEAYRLKPTEFSGPKWLDDDIFLVQATKPLNTPKDMARLMLQRALADRFGLKVHREKREISIFALVPGKNGATLQVADDAAHRQKTVATRNGSMHGSMYFTRGQFYSVAMTLDYFAEHLSNYVDLDRPVVNMTGLTAEYKFDMHWDSTEDTPGYKDPDFLPAIEKQLGLHLVKQQLPCDVLVVDQVERTPSEN